MSGQVAQQQASMSVGIIQAVGKWLAQTAALAAQTVYTVPAAADKCYRIDAVVECQAAGVASVTPQVSFTDGFGNAQTVPMIATQFGTGFASATFAGSSLTIRAKAGSNIQIAAVLGSGSAPTYNLYANVVEI